MYYCIRTFGSPHTRNTMLINLYNLQYKSFRISFDYVYDNTNTIKKKLNLTFKPILIYVLSYMMCYIINLLVQVRFMMMESTLDNY